MKRTFYAIVCEQDLPKDRTPSQVGDPPRGPLLFEAYLDEKSISADRVLVEQFARNYQFSRYDWVRVAEITVDIPDAPAALPANQAAAHA